MSSNPSTMTNGQAPRLRSSRPADRLITLNIASVAIGLVAWWLVSKLDLNGLPGPQAVLERCLQLIGNGSIFVDIGASLRRVFLGFAIGTLLAVPIGFLMGWYGWARGLLEPYIQFFRTIPPLAIIPVAIVFLGIGEVPKVFVITLAAFLVSVISTFQGVITVDKVLINAARVLGADDFTVFRRVVIPASTPFILVGMRVGLGAAWSTLVASELIAAQEGLGHRMQQAQVYYDLPTIFVGLVLIGVLGMVMDRAILWADKRLTTWQERR
ncbi:ABC transporter permease [Ramlibacter sp. 2FC]|uniref:ABC transporter permease n=1 Tax=Ramlibacter sp. 2FC TaxID=2502188 RepID=UPI0010F6BF2E|nr:ABC transporter permease [Ramlibacter sp. 2FC]